MKKLFLLLIAVFMFTGTASYAAVNINTATQAQLETLQGIGPAKAKAIVEHRKKKGLFRSVDDLQNVSGVGPVTVKRLRKDISVGGAPTVKKEHKAVARQ
ncbi:MAG: ComEA family DNA-binding protein [Nitrosospira sp.]|nr:ComEA family DNA-binding protein [Nitrosospira sp.]